MKTRSVAAPAVPASSAAPGAAADALGRLRLRLRLRGQPADRPAPEEPSEAATA